MRRTWHMGIAFGTCLAVLLAAMGWISLKALRLERAEIRARRQAEAARRQEAQARRDAALEEDVQLALYRMEFVATPLVARESARPYSVYRTFLAGDVPNGMDTGPPRAGRAVSPLVEEGCPDVLVHFQLEPDGRLTSPRVPGPAERAIVIPHHIGRADVEEARRQLARLAAVVDRETLLARLPGAAAEPAPVVVPLAETTAQRRMNDEYQRALAQRGRGVAEFSRRAQGFQQSANAAVQNFAPPSPASASSQAGGAPMKPFWIDDHLICARRVRVGRLEYIQGCLLNWPSIEQALLMAIEDLLPHADLQPVADDGAEESRRLAALPVRLVPGRSAPDEAWLGQVGSGAVPAEAERLLSPIRLSLLVAWGCVLLAAGAVAVLVAGVIRLSERRAAFVSAVTHELRTPLTTFHVYTEMLAEGMVPEGDRQQEYLSTLRAEASRLSHLVENVLSYARLERGRGDGRVERVSLGGLLEPILARLADRARQDGMEIAVEPDEDALATVVRANPSAVEQILLNLVDNAGKYARSAADKRIHVSFRRADGAIDLRVRDHGPGISQAASRRLFRSFSKSAHDAADSAPGVGLGLALSRRLARDMGARLRLDGSVTDGACFVLALPVVPGPSAG